MWLANDIRGKSMRQLQKLAKDTATPPHALALLARHGDPAIRRSVAANSNLDAFQRRLLAMDGDRLVRSRATANANRQPVGTGFAKSAESPSATLGPVVMLDGAGWAPEIGSRCLLDVYRDRIELGSTVAMSVVTLDSLRDLRVGGQSVTSGGGFFGGGFGAKGAVEGMLISTVLNSLTTKKSKWVTIRIVADGGWVDLRLDNYDVLPVRNTLRVLADWVIANQSSDPYSAAPDSPASSEPDLIASLDRLVEHRNSGVLTEAEFLAAKSRLLNA